MRDLVHTLRRLGRAPAFTITVLLTVGLGIGANVSIFSALYSILLKPLHYQDSDRLMLLHLAKQSGTVNPSLYTITDWREQTKTLETAAGGRILAGMVTSDFPAVFTMPLTLGRAFSEEEEIQNAPVAILTDRLWRSRFGGRSGNPRTAS